MRISFFFSKFPFPPLPSPELPPFFYNHFPYFFNTFRLSDLDEISYIDSFWDGICEVCILFRNFPPLPHLPNSPLPQKPSPLFLNTFPLSDLDETSYIDSFWDGICEVCILFRNSPHPSSKFPSSPKTIPSVFNTFPLSDLDETSYLDSFWDGICEICICSKFPLPSPPPFPKNHPPCF